MPVTVSVEDTLRLMSICALVFVLGFLEGKYTSGFIETLHQGVVFL